ncbi:hypothetical protein Poli38472_008068 [Pythium oligandrum]|uniref:subtilisin n=1 Tax=Pythium oligandrum TaxID=41045 RepID=A0A8K1CML7_PYTOL|nr:hypothetical protein Poli38472_008068 [Pythium oligandrum]|eukprot:TMW65426.1 hypothetical protein Poli38472_008068 [Pythium oligandrum]
MLRLQSAALSLLTVTGTLALEATKSRCHTQDRLDVIITMKQRTEPIVDSITEKVFSCNSDRVKAIKDGLETLAQSSQTGVLGLLGESPIHYTRSESYWITNQVYAANATQELVEQLSNHPDVASVAPEQVFNIEAISAPPSTNSTQWGVNKINTSAVWTSGNMGEGVIVGIIDTGVRATHVAIKNNWRSTYGWFDPLNKTLGSTPYDALSHGTHVAGVIAGNNGIGVAPNTQWIMCKGCRSDGCFTSDLLACFQFMTCPTRPNGSRADCSQMPRVVSNSWGGGQGLTIFDRAINLWRKAGIIPVFAAGNTGPNCGTVHSPGDNANVITVGSSDPLDTVSSFSARGPTVKGVVKPDIIAPGWAIKSSCSGSDTEYCTKYGTSMAAPHVAGAIALYLSAKPSATYNQVKLAFQKTAVNVTTPTGLSCGGTNDSMIPNNQFGYGRLDIGKALL